MSVISNIEKEQISNILGDKKIPHFGAGDTLKVAVKVIEGTRERIQSFEGVCIGRRNAGISSVFTVRKVSYGEGVERIFPLYSPRIDAIEVLRKGKVRRAKLYYLRERQGKSARIAERTSERSWEKEEKKKSSKPKKSEITTSPKVTKD
tara:strand:+ start:60 stop:506 length:447 start_codon:yes stop_codon:yes gene_type:complete